METEGDHIKISASRYPFPTVCADKQSTDWFHSISRTLKWNERQRQKSFVVVEEGPEKTSRARRVAFSSTADGLLSSEPLEEETEESDEEVGEDDDKFDIDDSSANDEQIITIHVDDQSEAEFTLGATKAPGVASQTDTDLDMAAAVLTHGLTPRFSRSSKSRSKSRSRSRSKSGLRSGVDTPGRFAGPTHSAPHLLDQRRSEIPSPTISDSDDSLSNMDRAQRGARDDLHSAQQYFSGRSRIPRDRDDDDPHTPTIPDHVPDRRSHHHPRASSREVDHQHRRAFAVWGNDETDSGTSDSDL